MQMQIVFLSEMKPKFFIISIVILLGFVLATQAGTYKPFVRSRYSLRWSKTTETPKVLDSTTVAAVDKTDVEKASNAILNLGVLPENALQITSLETILKTSTHMPDYDYYGNNEVEDSDHKHLINN